jgi:hypothetical protein
MGKHPLREVEKSFPNFTGQSLLWAKVPGYQDPPDFTSQTQNGPIELELVELLDGD